MNAVAALLGVLAVAAVLLLVSGLTPVDPADQPPVRRRTAGEVWAQYSRRPAGQAGRRRDLTLAGSMAAGVVLFAVTGWLLLILLVPVAALALPKLLGRPPGNDLHLLEALDRWVRAIATTLPVGRDVIDSIRVSLGSAPPLLAGDLAVLVDELNSRVTAPEALTRLADRLDNPESDAVIASLILATRRSGVGLSTSLNQLADNIQDRLRALREVERERDLPRSRVQQITVIACLMVAAAAFLGDYLRPYGSPTGQLILTVLVAAFVGCLWQMHRMTVPRRRQRILTTTNTMSGGGRS